MPLRDDFNRPDSTGLGPNWSTAGIDGTQTSPNVASNRATSPSGFRFAYWLPDTFKRDATSDIRLITVTGTDLGIVGLITSGAGTSAVQGYEVNYDPSTGNWFIYRYDSAASSPQIASGTAVAVATTSIIRIELTPSAVIAAYSTDDGVTWKQVGRATDTTYRSDTTIAYFGVPASGIVEDFSAWGPVPVLAPRNPTLDSITRKVWLPPLALRYTIPVQPPVPTFPVSASYALPFEALQGVDSTRPLVWSTPTSFAPSTNDLSAMVATGNTVHFAYKDSTSLKYRRSDDQGATWTSDATIATSITELPLSQAIAAEGQNVHVIFNRGDQLIYIHSTDNGATWSSEFTLDAAGLGGGYFFRNGIDVDNGTVHVVWCNASPTADGDIIYRRSTDNGATWQSIITLKSGAASRPDVSASGGAVHVHWSDGRKDQVTFLTYDSYYRRSTNAGASFSAEVQITDYPAGTLNIRPAVIAVGADVVLIWQANLSGAGTEDLYVQTSADTGATWTAPKVFAQATQEQEHVMLARRGKLLLAAWADRRSGFYNSWARISWDVGKTWELEQIVWSTGTDQGIPRIAIAGDYLVLAAATSGNYNLTRAPIQGVPVDLPAGVAAALAEPIEAAGGTAVAQTAQIPIEATQAVAGAPAAAIEALAGVAASAVAPLEDAQGVSQTAQQPIEETQGVARTAADPVESAQGIAAVAAEPVDAAGGVAQTGSLPLDEAAQITSTVGPTPVESTQGVATTALEPVEATQGVSSTAQAFVEALQGVASGLSLPIEEQSAGLSAVSSSAVLPIEALQAIAATGSAPLEELAGVATSAALPIDELAQILQTGSLTIESLANVSQASLVPFELLQGVGRAVLVPVEARGGVAQLAILPIEALSQLPATGIPVLVVLRDFSTVMTTLRDFPATVAGLGDRSAVYAIVRTG